MDLSELPSRPFRRHPWEAVRFRFACDVLRSAALDRNAATVLDAGAGDGWFASELLRRMPMGTEITCWDAGYSDEDLARLSRTAVAGIHFTATRPAGLFDVLLLLDVLEHVDDESAFLERLVTENLRPGGTVLVNVPAWHRLFGAHDLTLKHFRRYQPAECAALLRRAGLEVLEQGGLFHSLVIARAAGMLFERAFGRGRTKPQRLEWRYGAVAARLVEDVLALDTRLSFRFARAGLDVPGLSWWARCRKPS